MTHRHIMAGWDDALAAGALRFPRCDACRSWNWYPLPRCRACGSGSFTWTQVAPDGVLYSWTRVHRAFGGPPAAPLPYLTGIVDLDGAPGVRLVCLNTGAACEPRIGGRVKLALERHGDGARWTFTTVSI